MKFSDPADAEQARGRLDRLKGVVPQIRSLAVGVDFSRTAASYDLALVTTHEDRRALEGYREHPLHVEVLDWLGPRLTSRVVVDYES